MNSLKFKLLSILTILTIAITSFINTTAVYAENDFGIPDTLVGLTPSSINQYTPSKLIPYDAGKFRDFEIPMNSDTTYYKAKTNSVSTSNYSEIEYSDFRTALYKIFNNSKQNTRFQRKNIFYAKLYEYTGSSYGRTPTGRYVILLYAVSNLSNRFYYPFDINYLNPYDIGDNSKTTDNDHTKFQYARDHEYDPVLHTLNENLGIDFENNTLEYYSCSTSFESSQNIPYAVYESSTDSWIVNQSLLNDDAYYLDSGSVRDFTKYFSYIDPSCYTASGLIATDDQCQFGYYCDTKGENPLYPLFSTIQYKENFSNYKNSFNRTGCNDIISTSNDVNGVYCFSYFRLIEQELTEGSFSGFEALTITGVQQHSLYNIFSSTTLPNNDPFSSDVFYNVTITSGYPEYGTVSGDISVQRKQGETVTFTANPLNESYKFLRWSDGNTDITRTLTVNGDINLHALFATKTTYTISLTCEPEQAGHFEVSEIYYEGDNAEFKAIPYKGYVFSHWSDGNEDEDRTFDDIQQDHSLTAYFAPGIGGIDGSFDMGPIITVVIICAFLIMLKGF